MTSDQINMRDKLDEKYKISYHISLYLGQSVVLSCSIEGRLFLVSAFGIQNLVRTMMQTVQSDSYSYRGSTRQTSAPWPSSSLAFTTSLGRWHVHKDSVNSNIMRTLDLLVVMDF